MQSQQINFLETFPNEILLSFFRFGEYYHWANWSLVCKSFHLVCKPMLEREKEKLKNLKGEYKEYFLILKQMGWAKYINDFAKRFQLNKKNKEEKIKIEKLLGDLLSKAPSMIEKYSINQFCYILARANCLDMLNYINLQKSPLIFRGACEGGDIHCINYFLGLGYKMNHKFFSFAVRGGNFAIVKHFYSTYKDKEIDSCYISGMLVCGPTEMIDWCMDNNVFSVEDLLRGALYIQNKQIFQYIEDRANKKNTDQMKVTRSKEYMTNYALEYSCPELLSLLKQNGYTFSKKSWTDCVYNFCETYSQFNTVENAQWLYENFPEFLPNNFCSRLNEKLYPSKRIIKWYLSLNLHNNCDECDALQSKIKTSKRKKKN